ncbi:hypothetical protein BOW53_06910 [Solemya pervernicosa gill symbiont]|uniref:cyclic-guanylate-specific phosphodiesterase n=2 Tax=Gammaproteobacteria incertae sedis TaxID=118884 RepID=A0A1T2L6H0_9GAMM|nr:EAL domain-containing protein [Candidatus Reidiella endopervernicosa]OOZ40652.1 hypothetical protein BOW53_06910 [Solemya pervernicosa gill symbiont]QKQ27408.1 EAL domain-containing protein [Candidatus Reidiella endopervernicosa]
MNETQGVFARSALLLRSRVNRFAIQGLVVALAAVGVASAVVGYMHTDQLSLDSIMYAQQINSALWMLDAMPFLFALWGQYAGSIMSIEAGAMVLDQTRDLRMQAESLEIQLAHDTTHDRLTELPNRVLFHDRVGQAIEAAHRDLGQLALLAVNIDNFKSVNEALGHFSGDLLLKQVAGRLKSVVRSPDTVARLGGDEFALLVPHLNTGEDAKLVADKVVEVLKQPYLLGGVEIEMLASIGIAIYPDHISDAVGLLQKLDVALYSAKQISGYSTMVYSPEQDQMNPERLSLLGELRRAIEREELDVYYQPKVNIKEGRTVAVEALVRWNHPQRGMLPPIEFILLSERTGLIKPLTLHVLNESVRQCAEWHQAGLEIHVAVNVSAKMLLDPELPSLVVEILKKHQLASNHLIIEITESSIMEDQERALANVTKLAELGTRISIDDFGTGYSSLAYLRRLPVDEIKIDQSFVMPMLENDSDAVIVKATIGLVHNLGMSVIAEGVESGEILQKLGEMDCDQAQGYHISRPVPGAELTKLLTDSAWSVA